MGFCMQMFSFFFFLSNRSFILYIYFCSTLKKSHSVTMIKKIQPHSRELQLPWEPWRWGDSVYWCEVQDFGKDLRWAGQSGGLYLSLYLIQWGKVSCVNVYSLSGFLVFNLLDSELERAVMVLSLNARHIPYHNLNPKLSGWWSFQISFHAFLIW